MSFDPVAALRQADEQRFQVLEELDHARLELKKSIENYHACYKQAREHGWAPTDLGRVGFPDPKKYARLRDPKQRTHPSIEHTFNTQNGESE